MKITISPVGEIIIDEYKCGYIKFGLTSSIEKDKKAKEEAKRK